MSNRLTSALPYALPPLIVAAALLLSLSFEAVVPHAWPAHYISPLLLIAVAITAWRGSYRSAVLAAALGWLCL